MVQKSHGSKRGTRRKLRAKKITITRRLQRFNVGDIVHVDVLPTKGMPYHRFQGKTGRIVGERGNAYIVEVRDGNKPKTLITKPEHFKKGGDDGNNK